MYGNTRYILYLVIILNLFLFISAYDEMSGSKDRSRRHILSLLGYLHGYKVGQDVALQLPPLVLSPVIIIPSVNQQQSVNVQKSSSGENYQENGGTFQNISPARLVVNSAESNSELKNHNQFIKPEITKYVEDSIIENNSDIDTLRQAIPNETDVTVTSENIDEYSTTVPYTETTISELENVKVENVTKPSGPYANAVYNNNNLSTLLITTIPLEYNLTVPDAEDKWQNFSMPSNEFESSTNNISKDNTSTIVGNVVFNPSRELNFLTKPYTYPRAWYNSKVDRLSITTNSYTNEDSALPPTYDDRWQRFTSLRKSYPSSGFRPLAGLYYDGFLHKSLTKEIGFMPYRNNGYYYN